MLELSNDSSEIQFPVVGIGASAGGLEAIKLFLNGIPEQ
jgi:two-component system, chemotaxis family, CheB/CheR fusion protein